LAVWFVDLVRWDIKTAIAALFRAAHPDFVPLGNFAEECGETVRPFDQPETLWPVYGVNNRGGVFFSHHQPGAEFNAPYKSIKRNWFFHNPTRANVGSLGRVPDVEENAITSPEYQVWRIKDESWLPEYMEILIQMPFFNTLIHVHRVGAVKERLYAQNLLEIPVPPRSTEFQRAIVKQWREARAAADEALALAERIEKEAEREFLERLGLTPANNSLRRKAFALSWEEMERWSYDFLARKTFSETKTVPRFPLHKLGEICSGKSGGTPAKARANYWSGAIPWVSPKDMKAFEINDSEDHVSEEAIAESGVPLLPENSILIVVRSGILQRTVPVALAQREVSINQDMRAFTVKDERVIPRYVGEFMAASVTRLLGLVKYGTTVQSINKEELENFPVCVPPVDIQQEMIEARLGARQQAAAARAKAENLKARAAAEIEAAILGGAAAGPEVLDAA
jgi:type I restriction enzyme S subunit